MIAERIERLRAIMTADDVDAVVVSNPPNRAYLSGFYGGDHGPDESTGMLLVDRNGARFFASKTNLPMIAAAIDPVVTTADSDRDLPKAIGEAIFASGGRRIGIEENGLTVKMRDDIVAGFRGASGNDDTAPEVVHLGDAIDDLRAIKDAAEVSAITEAVRLTDEAFTRVAATIVAGDTEREIVLRLNRMMEDLGADGLAFDTIVAAGPNAARPHHEPGHRRIQEGEPIIIDMGARYHGYCADLTRTVWVGQPDPKLREIYPIVLRALEATIDQLKAGMTTGAGDALARDVIGEAGFGEQFVHGLGHGVGIKIHEAPSMRKDSEDMLVAGNTVTIEPGIYIEDWGGVRIEDFAIITGDGLTVLSRAPKMNIASGEDAG